MKNIIFDIGNVLIEWNPNIVYKKYFAGDTIKMNRFYEETGIHQANTEMDRGSSFQEVLTELINKFPLYREPILLWKTEWLNMVGGPIATSIQILESLHAQNYPLYALTNFATETFFTYIRPDKKYAFLDYFKDIVISGIEHTIKPDLAIYKILLARNKLDPKNCIYIDDSPINLPPAQELGMATIRFTSPAQLKERLEELEITTI